MRCTFCGSDLTAGVPACGACGTPAPDPAAALAQPADSRPPARTGGLWPSTTAGPASATWLAPAETGTVATAPRPAAPAPPQPQHGPPPGPQSGPRYGPPPMPYPGPHHGAPPPGAMHYEPPVQPLVMYEALAGQPPVYQALPGQHPVYQPVPGQFQAVPAARRTPERTPRNVFSVIAIVLGCVALLLIPLGIGTGSLLFAWVARLRGEPMSRTARWVSLGGILGGLALGAALGALRSM